MFPWATYLLPLIISRTWYEFSVYIVARFCVYSKMQHSGNTLIYRTNIGRVASLESEVHGLIVIPKGSHSSVINQWEWHSCNTGTEGHWDNLSVLFCPCKSDGYFIRMQWPHLWLKFTAKHVCHRFLTTAFAQQLPRAATWCSFWFVFSNCLPLKRGNN